MSKQLDCCKQTSALDVATQWACAELLQRWVCCITTTESSLLLCHHNIGQGGGWWGNFACMTQDAGRTKVVGRREAGRGTRWHPLAVTGWKLVQCNSLLQQALHRHLINHFQYSQHCFVHTDQYVPSPLS